MAVLLRRGGADGARGVFAVRATTPLTATVGRHVIGALSLRGGAFATRAFIVTP